MYPVSAKGGIQNRAYTGGVLCRIEALGIDGGDGGIGVAEDRGNVIDGYTGFQSGGSKAVALGVGTAGKIITEDGACVVIDELRELSACQRLPLACFTGDTAKEDTGYIRAQT